MMLFCPLRQNPRSQGNRKLLSKKHNSSSVQQNLGNSRININPQVDNPIRYVNQNYQAQDEDELSVVTGETVILIHPSKDDPKWTYIVRTFRGFQEQGFVPASILCTLNEAVSPHRAKYKNDGPISQLEIFTLPTFEEYLVLFDFNAKQENDLSVKKTETVIVLNKDDPDWYWVQRKDNYEGFVPTSFMKELGAVRKILQILI